MSTKNYNLCFKLKSFLVLFQKCFTNSKKYDKCITEISKTECNSFLNHFYTSARQKDRSYCKENMAEV